MEHLPRLRAKYGLKEQLLRPLTHSGLLACQSLQTHAVQPNAVQTHKALFQILVEILKFPEEPSLFQMMVKTPNIFYG